MLTLHSYRRCPFAIRVRMVLEEKGVAYDLIEESLREPSGELLRLHPEGKVPLLKHGELVLYESAVITEYLDEVLPGIVLTPPGAVARAQMRLWTYWSQTLFKADLDAFKYHPPKEPEALGALRRNLVGHTQKLEAALHHGFLLGSEFSLADLHVFPLVRQLAKTTGADFIPARVLAWLETISTRPSFVRVMEKRA